MKTMYSLSQLAASIEASSACKADFIVPTSSIQMLGLSSPTLSFSRDHVDRPMLRTAHGQLAELVDVPRAYYDRMLGSAPELLASNVNHWLQAQPATQRRMVRTNGSEVRALLSDSYRRIDNHEVAEVALSILAEQPGLEVVSTAVTESRLYIKAVSRDVALPVVGSKRVGDVVEAGVLITNSETGQGSVSIKPFHRYLACLNGMVIDKGGYRAAHIGRKADLSIEGLLSDTTRKFEDELVLRKVRDIIRSCFDMTAFRAFMDSISATTQQHIEGDVNAAVEALGPTLQLGVGERQSVLRHLIVGGDLSRFGLVNAVTRTAEDAGSYDRATELEAAGFRLVDMGAREWRANSEAKPLQLAA